MSTSSAINIHDLLMREEKAERERIEQENQQNNTNTQYALIALAMVLAFIVATSMFRSQMRRKMRKNRDNTQLARFQVALRQHRRAAMAHAGNHGGNGSGNNKR